MLIEAVAVEEIYPLRHKVLRIGKPFATCQYPEDRMESAFHLAAKRNKLVIGIASFYLESHSDLTANRPYRLRGMAVEPELQGAGIGSKLLLQAFDICNKAGADLLWCNARTVALNFYQNLGFEIQGEPFDLQDIGKHYLMFKRL